MTYDVEHLSYTYLPSLYLLKNFLMFIFERERKRERVIRGGAESEGDTESEAGSRL